MVISATGIMIKEKQILLVKRSNYTKAFPGHWTMPGGRAEENETPEQTVVREIKEETNLKFIPKRLFHKSNWRESAISF